MNTTESPGKVEDNTEAIFGSSQRGQRVRTSARKIHTKQSAVISGEISTNLNHLLHSLHAITERINQLVRKPKGVWRCKIT